VLPLVVFEDMFSVSGNCAHNLKTPFPSPQTETATQPATNATIAPVTPANGWHNIGHCLAADLQHTHYEGDQRVIHPVNNHITVNHNFSYHNMTGDQLRRVYIRDTSNRGPLAMSGPKLRRLGFLDEVCCADCAVLCCAVR
jgi:hypothetical protein